MYTVSFPVLASGSASGISLCYIGLTCRKDQNPVSTVSPFRPFIKSSLFPSLSQTTSLNYHLPRITRLDPSFEALCRRQAAPTPGPWVSVPRDPSTSSLPHPRALFSRSRPGRSSPVHLFHQRCRQDLPARGQCPYR
jgi:hypothetical protein